MIERPETLKCWNARGGQITPYAAPVTYSALVKRGVVCTHNLLGCVMAKMKDFKRENFDVSPEQQASIEMLQPVVDAPTKKGRSLDGCAYYITLSRRAKER